MKPGLYADLITQNFIQEIDHLKASGIVPPFGKIEPAKLPNYLIRFLAAQLTEASCTYA